MTILCDYEIKALCTDGMVQNHDEALVNPASLDLRLGDTIMIESAENLDMRPLSIAGRTAENPYELKPGQFILAQTIEVFNMPENIAGLFFLKSSRAREGYENLHAGSWLAWQRADLGAEEQSSATAAALVSRHEDRANGILPHEPKACAELRSDWFVQQRPEHHRLEAARSAGVSSPFQFVSGVDRPCFPPVLVP
jgi:hypothetical protein